MRLGLMDQADAAALLQGRFGIDKEITCVSVWKVDGLTGEDTKRYEASLHEGFEKADPDTRFTIIVLEQAPVDYRTNYLARIDWQHKWQQLKNWLSNEYDGQDEVMISEVEHKMRDIEQLL